MVADPVAQLGLYVAIVLVAAKVGGDLAVRAGQPSVFGELVAGIALGSVPLPFLERMRTDPYLDVLAGIGVLVLLFEVGLESTVREVARVGVASGRVAALGMVGTMGAGWIAATLAIPGARPLLRAFLAAALAATSIGVGARVLRDAGASRSVEGRTILGAAVIDDVLGLVVLAAFSGAVAQSAGGREITVAGLALILAKTLGFLTVAVGAGVRFSPLLFRLVSRLRSEGALVAAGLSLCFVMAWAASAVGLAPIVGAFTAGLVLEESHSARFVARGEQSLAERMEPISAWLVPVFFVLMGMRADLRALAHPATLALAAGLTVAAIAGKLACAAGAPAGSDRMAVAFGMLPRGEVTLVFANLGLTAELLDAGQYSALVAVVAATALVTPLALRRRLARVRRESPART